MSPVDRQENGFTITTDLSAQTAVVTVRGSLDLLAVPQLSALFDMVVSEGFSSVVVDMSGLDTVATECLAVMAEAAERLAALDRRLSLRAPSSAVQRVLDINGLKGLEVGDASGSSFGHLIPTAPAHLMAAPAPAGAGSPLPGLPVGAPLPSQDEVIDGALRMVVALARATVGAADGVSVSLRRHGRLGTVAATNQTILDMDGYQYATGEGPCIDASIEGQRFYTQSLGQEERWPAFIPKAHRLGINAILSSPLHAGEQAVGALNIYSRTAFDFAAEDQDLASVFAAEASIMLTQAAVEGSADGQADRFHSALQMRQAIALAQGVIMERDGISADDAYTRLRRHSQQTDQPLRDHAEEIIASARRPERGLGSEQRGDHRG